MLIIDKYFVDQNCMQKKGLICSVPFLGFLKKNSGKKVCYDLVEGMTLGSSSFLLQSTNFK
jgi:hypothetical protein